MFKTTIPGNLQPGEQVQEFTIPKPGAAVALGELIHAIAASEPQESCANLAQRAFVEFGVSAELLMQAASPRIYGVMNDPWVEGVMRHAPVALPKFGDFEVNHQTALYAYALHNGMSLCNGRRASLRVSDSIILDIDDAQYVGRSDREAIVKKLKDMQYFGREDRKAVTVAIVEFCTWHAEVYRDKPNYHVLEKQLDILRNRLSEANCQDIENTIINVVEALR